MLKKKSFTCLFLITSNLLAMNSYNPNSESYPQAQIIELIPNYTLPQCACFFAAKTNKASILNKLIKDNDLSPNDMRDQLGQTLLHVAASNGSPTVMTFLLLNYNQLLNIQDKAGFTALHRAIIHKQLEAAYILIAAGADRTIKNKYRKKPIDLTKDKNLIFLLTQNNQLQ